jgi:hypothetical protein
VDKIKGDATYPQAVRKIIMGFMDTIDALEEVKALVKESSNDYKRKMKNYGQTEFQVKIAPVLNPEDFPQRCYKLRNATAIYDNPYLLKLDNPLNLEQRKNLKSLCREAIHLMNSSWQNGCFIQIFHTTTSAEYLSRQVIKATNL